MGAATTTCPTCGAENPADAGRCRSCARPLDSGPPESAEVRKTVTVVFTDVIGSTEIGERLDPESLRRVMSHYFEAMRAVLQRHGGSVEKFIGDAVMAVFGVPFVHEDDALRAVRAAAEMREALEALNEDLQREWGVRIQARTGVNTGEVVTGDRSGGQSLVVGDAVNVAARLEQAADTGQILIGQSTYRLVRDAVKAEPTPPLRLRGKGDLVSAFALIDVLPAAPGIARRLHSPMVGREGERTLLHQAFERTARDRTCHLFTILGAAGVGKSRLALEVMAACQTRGTVLTGRCLPYGEGITFWPVVEVVRQAARLSEEDSPEEALGKITALLAGADDADLVAARVAQVVGLGDATADTEEIAWAVRRMFETLARSRPVVVVFDDVHWAEPTLLDLVDHVADWSRGAPILLVCLGRPELLDQRPMWGGGKLNATTILLEPLTDEESTALLSNLLGRTELAEEARRRITTAAEGNPLFVEELLSMLIDDGLLRRTDGRWEAVGDLSAVSVPMTITALLTARLERLGAGERAVLERASVEGKVFHRDAVSALSPERVRPDVTGHLQALVRKELIRPADTGFTGHDAFQFRHLLIRDAAYRGMPKETRADLHARFAAWLGETAGEWLPEYEEIVGYHLEQSYRYREELGPIDLPLREMAARAADHLGRAGRRGIDRGDMRAAANLLERAAGLLGEDPARFPHLLRLAEALVELGEFAHAEEVLSGVLRDAAAAGDQRIERLAHLSRLQIRINVDPGGVTEEAHRLAEDAVRFFEERDDAEGLAKAWHVVALARWNEARAADTEEALEAAVRHARRAGDRRSEIDDLSLMTMLASWGPRPVPAAIERSERILERAGGHRKVEAFSLITRGTLEARRGDMDRARELVEQGRGILRDLGLRVYAAATSQSAGQVEMLAGHPEAAERELRAGFEALEKMGEKAYLSTTAGYLADALCAQDRLDEAGRFARISEEAADPKDLASQILWRSTRARVMARRGDVNGAQRLVADAMALAEGLDFPDTRGDLELVLAEVLQLAGHRHEAAEHVRRALDLYERKGNAVSAERGRAMLGSLTP